MRPVADGLFQRVYAFRAARGRLGAGEDPRPGLGWSRDQAHRRRQAFRHRPGRRPAGSRLRRSRHCRRGDRGGRAGRPRGARDPGCSGPARRHRAACPRYVGDRGGRVLLLRRHWPSPRRRSRTASIATATSPTPSPRTATLSSARTSRRGSATPAPAPAPPGGPPRRKRTATSATAPARTPSPPTTTRSSARTTRRSTPRRPRPRAPRPTTSRPRTQKTRTPRRRRTSPTPARSPSPASTSGSWCCSGMVLVGGGLGARKLLAQLGPATPGRAAEAPAWPGVIRYSPQSPRRPMSSMRARQGLGKGSSPSGRQHHRRPVVLAVDRLPGEDPPHAPSGARPW